MHLRLLFDSDHNKNTTTQYLAFWNEDTTSITLWQQRSNDSLKSRKVCCENGNTCRNNILDIQTRTFSRFLILLYGLTRNYFLYWFEFEFSLNLIFVQKRETKKKTDKMHQFWARESMATLIGVICLRMTLKKKILNFQNANNRKYSESAQSLQESVQENCSIGTPL